MIVDVHYHLIPLDLPEEAIKGILDEPKRAAKIIGIEVTEEELIQRAKHMYSDRTGEKMIKSMDEAGIDFTLICHVDNVDNPVVTSEFTQMINKAIADIANKYPDRVMALAGVDPRRPEALDMLKQCFEEYGMKGLKYHPDNGYDPSGPESYKLLEYLEKRDGILLTHTGPLYPNRSKFTDPILLSDVTVDFPNLKVIAAHMGQMNWRRWGGLAAMTPNLYGDLAMWPPFAFGKFNLFCRELRDIIDYVGVEKILFGSDSPVYDIVLPIKDVINKFKSLPTEAPKGITFTEEEINAILGGNAAALLGLNK